MRKRKQPKSRFVLEEEMGVVEISLLDESDYSLQRMIHEMPHPRIRAPRRTRSQIENESEFMARINHEPQNEFLKKSIRGVNREINKHVQDIRKTVRRMQSLTHYIVTAQEVLEEIES